MSGVLLLFTLGVIGWQILRVTGISNASLLGTVLLVGAMRAFGVQLPNTPLLFSDVLQVTLGFLVGSMLTRETLRNMRKYLSPTVLTAFWICGFALSAGVFLSMLTSLDPLTAMLAASPGGLPEMTVIAVDTNADVTIVILIHVLRIFLVMGCFTFVVPYFLEKSATKLDIACTPQEGSTVDAPEHPLRNISISGLMAAVGGVTFIRLNIPAGGMVGAFLGMIVATSIGHGVRISSRLMLDLLLIGVGILASDNITPAVVQTLFSRELVVPLVLSTALTFSSSALLAILLHKITNWDRVTCLLATAPAGLTAMAALAIQYERDPVPISVIQLCRIFVLKIFIPLIVTAFF